MFMSLSHSMITCEYEYANEQYEYANELLINLTLFTQPYCYHDVINQASYRQKSMNGKFAHAHALSFPFSLSVSLSLSLIISLFVCLYLFLYFFLSLSLLLSLPVSLSLSPSPSPLSQTHCLASCFVTTITMP